MSHFKNACLLLAVFPLMAAAPASPGGSPVTTAPTAVPVDPMDAYGRVTGAALVEVVGVREVDSRPSDGNLVDIVALKLVKSTGLVATDIRITKAYGGRRIGPAPVVKSPLVPDPFQAGSRYYVVFGPESDAAPEGVLACWAEKAAPQAVEAAVAADRYAKPAAITQPR